MRIFSAVLLAAFSLPAWAAHGYALWGELKYPPGFAHFDYVNPTAPKGGEIRLVGNSRASTFDKYNPFTIKGSAPTYLSELLFDSLLAGSLDEAGAAEKLVGSLSSEARGTLRVSASVAFGTLHVAPALAEFLPRHPELKIDLSITDRWVNLAEDGYDVAIHVTGDPQPNLVARPLAPVRRKLCATPDYFRRKGIPQTPADLVAHNCLDYTRSGEPGRWRFTGPEGEIAVPVNGPLHVDDDEALSQAVLGGLGVGLLPTFIIGQALQNGRLQAVLSEYIPVERHVYAMYLPTRHLPSKVRVFIDFLVAHIGDEPYWDR